jgi:hypothetical protein
LKVQHCGTDDMIADYFTKPLQGSQSIKFRDLILRITDIDSTDQIRSVLGSDLNWPKSNGQNNMNENHNDQNYPTVEIQNQNNDENVQVSS